MLLFQSNSGDHLVLLPNEAKEHFSDEIHVWEHETGELREIAVDFAEVEAGSTTACSRRRAPSVLMLVEGAMPAAADAER